MTINSLFLYFIEFLECIRKWNFYFHEWEWVGKINETMQLVKKFYNQEVMFRHVQSAVNNMNEHLILSDVFWWYRCFFPQKLKNSLLQHIIYSKRVLADHIELLEQCQVIPIDSVEHLTRTESLQFLGVFTVFSTLAVFSLKTDSKWYYLLSSIQMNVF